MRAALVLRRFAVVVAALGALAGLVIGVTAGVVAALGGDPGTAVAALLRGCMGTHASQAETLVRSTPLILTGLAVAFAFRAGLFNIGAEGQLLVGMLSATLAALTLPALPPVVGPGVCLIAGAVGGMLWALAPGWLRLQRQVPEVISTIMLNFLAVYLIDYLVRGPLKDPASVDDWSRRLPDWARLARLVTVWPEAGPWGRLHAGIALAVGLALLMWFWSARTGIGFRLRAVGLNPDAAAAAGQPVARTLLTAMLLSGALAGLAGAVEQIVSLSRLHRYSPGEPGYGFSGIAVALLGGLHPAGVLASALFFGALAAGCQQMEREAGVGYQLAYVIQAAVIILVLAVTQSRLGRAVGSYWEGGSGRPDTTSV